MLVESGALADGGAELEDLPVPTSLQGLIGSRLDGLPGDQKRLAQHASVAGAIFWSGAASHLVAERRQRRRRARVARGARRRPAARRVDGRRRARVVVQARAHPGRRLRQACRRADAPASTCASPSGSRPSARCGEDFVEIVAHHLEQACLLAREVSRTDVPPPVPSAVARSCARPRSRSAARATAKPTASTRVRSSCSAPTTRSRRSSFGSAARASRRSSATFRPAREELLAVADGAQRLGRRRPPVRSAARAREHRLEAGARRRRASSPARGVRARRRARRPGAAGTGGVPLGERPRVVRRRRGRGDPGAARRPRARRGARRPPAAHRGAHDPRHRLLELRPARRCAAAVRGGTRVWRVRAEAPATRRGPPRCSPTSSTTAATSPTPRSSRCRRSSGSSGRATSTCGSRRSACSRASRCSATTWTLAEQRLREALPIALELGGWLVIDTYRYLVELLVRQERIDEARELLRVRAARRHPQRTPTPVRHTSSPRRSSWPPTSDLEARAPLASRRRSRCSPSTSS